MKYLALSLIIFFNLAASPKPPPLPWPLKTNPKISYLGQTVFKTGASFESAVIGGLSGLFALEHELWTITDKNFGGDNYCFIFEVDLTKDFLVKPIRKISLKKPKNHKSFSDEESDQESITVLPDKNFLTTIEGDLHGFKQHLPSIYYFDAAGVELQQLLLPEVYLPNNKNNRGIFDNKGPEAFTYFKENNQDFFVLSSEFPLRQDEQKNRYPIRVSILATKKNNNLWDGPKLINQFLYLLDDDNTGLVDFTYIDQNTLITLERTFNPLALHVSGKIFKVTWDKKTTAIQDLKGLKKNDLKKIVPLKKTLLVDLEEVAKNAGLTLDNFEGIAVIPNPDKDKVVLGIVSDNNYNSMQQTVFAGFSLKKEVLK